MPEATVIINAQFLSESQSHTVRTACVGFLMMLDDPLVVTALGKAGIIHRANIDTILKIMDEVLVH